MSVSLSMPAARAAAAAVQPTSPQGEVSPTLRLLLREKPPLRQTLTPPPPETNPSQAESPDSRDGTAEAKERLIRAVTAILNPLVNPPPLQEQCVVTLHTLCKNVIDNPTDDRYRREEAENGIRSRREEERERAVDGVFERVFEDGKYERLHRRDDIVDIDIPDRVGEQSLLSSRRA